MERKRAIIVGAGIGGLALGIRLQAKGFDTTIVEAQDVPGGRGAVRVQDGHTFDLGPTVITVPHFIEELFALERDGGDEHGPDFPKEVLTAPRVTAGPSGGPATRKYVDLVPILPFYRIYFDDGTFFDYDGDPASTRAQIAKLAPEDLDGYERFHADAQAIFERGFLELGYRYFGDITSMVSILPDLLRLGAVRTLFSFVEKYFTSPKLRQVFSFETLLVGGSPLRVPAIYAMIHFVEKTWGIHYAMGGTGALVRGFVKKFEELGGTLRLSCPVAKIEVTDGNGGPPGGLFSRRVARGVELASGERLTADLVISNADYANTYAKLIDPRARVLHGDLRVKLSAQSMSLFVLYFGFKDDPKRPLDLRHHNILLGPRYEGLLDDIFVHKRLSEDFSQYLHIPTLTDPSLAPPGCHTAYTLVPVPNLAKGDTDWSVAGPALEEKVIRYLDERGFIPGLRERLTTKFHLGPPYFETTLRSHLGNAFGPEPTLPQSAWFRPHNKSEDIERLYLVGAGTQPGAGTPAVMMSAKMTAREIAKDYAPFVRG